MIGRSMQALFGAVVMASLAFTLSGMASAQSRSPSPLRPAPFTSPFARPATPAAKAPLASVQQMPVAEGMAGDAELAASTTWTTVFFDNFGATTLNRARWNVVGPDFWVNNEQQAYVDSPQTIFIRNNVPDANRGVLVLKPVYKPGADTNTARKAAFISGRIDTSNKFDFQYGRVSARIKMSDAQGFWPAFWLLGYGNWPDSGEIDAMENVGEKGWISSALHGPGYSGNTPLASRYSFPAGKDVTGWHTYTVVWGATQISFIVDGVVFYRVLKTDVEKYGPWRFSNRKYLILNAALGGSYPNAINRVTSPYFGVPQATVDKVKAGQVEYQIDWIKVQQKS